MDVYILSVCIPALINTSIVQTQVDHKVAKHILSLTDGNMNVIPSHMEVKFTMGTKTLSLDCKVDNFEEEDVHIHLGMDFLSQQHFRLKLGDATLYGHNRWSTRNPDYVQFAYNANYGKHLRERLERLNYPMLPSYSRRTLPDDKPRKYFSRFRDAKR